MIGPERRLRGPSGPRLDVRTGWVHVYLRSVQIAGTHMNVIRGEVSLQRGVEMCRSASLSAVAQYWGPALAELFNTMPMEIDS